MKEVPDGRGHLHLGLTPLQLELKHHYIWVQPWISNLTTLDLNLNILEVMKRKCIPALLIVQS